MYILNLGCGADYRESNDETRWLNVDISPNIRTDQIVDGFKVPYPFEDQQFDGVLAQDFLEHVPHTIFDKDFRPIPVDGFILVLDEIWRILKPNGILEARCPSPNVYFNCFADPTHQRVVFPQSFEWYFTTKGPFSFYTNLHWEYVGFTDTPEGNLIHQLRKPG